MNKIATLFIVTLITLPMIFSVRISADKFTEIQNEIKDFCNSISDEQKEADAILKKTQDSIKTLDNEDASLSDIKSLMN